MLDLLKQYKQAKRELIEMLKGLGNSQQDKNDKTQINSMIDSVTHIIKWIETGRNPYFEQGIDASRIYHVHYYKDMDILPDIYTEMKKEREELDLTSEQRRALIKIFNLWSERERECFIMHVGEGKSMSEISNVLGISKASVQMYIRRAREKVEKVIEG